MVTIDLSSESVIPIAKARLHIPGNPVFSTVWKYYKRGELESFMAGGRRFTSVEACHRFVEKSNARNSTVVADV